jgi:hypothetical protein
MDQLLQFFFKYKWSLFSKGDLQLAGRPAWIIVLLVALALGALVYFVYVRPHYRITQRRQADTIAGKVT